MKNINTLENLLKETPEAYYWIGFLMADGCISKRIYKRPKKNFEYLNLKLSVHKDDEKSVIKFSNFILQPKYYFEKNMITISIMDNVKLLQIMKKFDWHFRKTYNPCNNLNIENDELFLSFLIGLIDGDGCIRKMGKKSIALEVVGHKVWKNVFEKWFNRLYSLSGANEKVNNLIRTSPKIFIPRTHNTTTVHFQCSNPKVLEFLKNKTIELKLPCLSRKWDKVLNDYSDRYSKSMELKREIKIRLTNGIEYATIQKELGVSKSYISQIRKSMSGQRKVREEYPTRTNGRFVKNET